MQSTSTLLIRCAIIAGCVSPAALAADAGQPVGIYARKEFRPLQLDPARIAVKAPEASLPTALTAAGLDPALATKHVLPGGWWFVSTPADVTTEAQLRAVVTSLSAQPGVEYASPVFFDDFGGPMFPTPAIIAGFAPGADREGLARAEKLAPWGAPEWESFPDMDLARLPLRSGFDVLALANRLAQSPLTEFAEPDMNFTGRTDAFPNDPFFTQQWAVHNTGQSGGNTAADMNGPEAWDITTGFAGIRCQIIDVGVDLAHPDLNLGGPHADFTGENGGGAPVNACDKHGTAVAGCVSARWSNALGVTGIAPNCLSQSARTFISTLSCNGSWNSNASWTVSALNQAQTSGCRVTNNSNGYGFTSASIDTAYANTRLAGIVHFASAGNSGAASIGYPASIPAVNAVAAMDRFNNRAGFSQYGTGLDFSAPGVDVLSTDQTGAAGYVSGDYVSVNGTSFASPYSAGVACLILSLNSTLNAAQVEGTMQATCKPLGAAGYDTDYGWGFVDAYAALQNTPANPPSNNACASAIALPTGSTTVFGTLIGATSDAVGSGYCGSSTTNPDVWYKLTAPSCGIAAVYRINVNTCGTNDGNGTDTGIDTVISLHTACGNAPILCDDDVTSCPQAGSQYDSEIDTTLLLNPGASVFIRVSKFGTKPVGTFILNSSFAPVNDHCDSAISVSDGSVQFCNIAADTDGPTEANCSFCCGDTQVNGDLWYRYTAPVSGTVTMSTCNNASFDTKIAVYNACPAAPDTAISCNDDACDIVRSVVTFPALANQQFLVRVGAYATTRGTGTLTISSAPSACDADLNQDGNTDQADVDYLINVIAGGANPTGIDPDFNLDGNADQSDVDALINVIAGGACP